MRHRVEGLLLLLLVACGESKGGDSEGSLPNTVNPTTGSAGTAGRSSVSIGGAAGSSAEKDDSTEKGLCSIAIVCTEAIVDEPPVSCTFELKDSSGATVFADHAGVELRGRSSIKFPKKNYAVELRDASGVEKSTSLLGMGKEADWVLDGAWADRSFMRNRLTFSLFRDMDPLRWAPRARYCEVTLNQKSQGIYVLLEKIKRDDDRVTLPDDDGSGTSFLIKQDENGALKLGIGAGSKWQVLYPGSQAVTDVQTRAIQAWLDRLGAALSGTDPNALLAMFDRAAIIDWILLEEFSKNVDAYNLSLYFAHDAGGARVIPWDLDLAYGQPTIRNVTGNESPEGWVHNRTNLISKLSTIDGIRIGLGPRWRTLRSGVFSESTILGRVDTYEAVLTPTALAANFKLWPIEQVDFAPYYAPYSFYDVTSYAEEVAHLRSWIQQRLTWIDANIDKYPSK